MDHDFREMIAVSDPRLKPIFFSPFDSGKGWHDFLVKEFGQSPSIKTLALAAGQPERYFQSLYIACWVYQPVVKGTFLISYETLPHSPKGVWDAVNNLAGRWSSHLGTHSKTLTGHSASEVERPEWRIPEIGVKLRPLASGRASFKFVQGGNELLVQNIKFDGDQAHTGTEYTGRGYLMLKMEGHLAHTLSHLVAFKHKGKGKFGKVFNNALADLATQEDHLNIIKANEYANGWNAVIKAVAGSKASTLTTSPATLAHDVVAELCGVIWSKETKVKGQLHARYNFFNPSKTPESISRDVYCMDNSDVGVILEYLLEEAQKEQVIESTRINEVFKKMRQYKDEVRSIIRSLQSDRGRHSRFASEVIIRAPELDAELSQLMDVITSHHPGGIFRRQTDRI